MLISSLSLQEQFNGVALSVKLPHLVSALRMEGASLEVRYDITLKCPQSTILSHQTFATPMLNLCHTHAKPVPHPGSYDGGCSPSSSVPAAGAEGPCGGSGSRGAVQLPGGAAGGCPGGEKRLHSTQDMRGCGRACSLLPRWVGQM